MLIVDAAERDLASRFALALRRKPNGERLIDELMIANALLEHRANAVRIAAGAEAENAVVRSVAKRIVDDLRYDAECRMIDGGPLIGLIVAEPKRVNAILAERLRCCAIVFAVAHLD